MTKLLITSFFEIDTILYMYYDKHCIYIDANGDPVQYRTSFSSKFEVVL